MLVKSEMIDALNEQIGNEFGASLQYVVLAAYFDSESLPILAQRFYAQGNEERDHAMRMVKYVLDVGGQLVLPGIPTPRSGIKSALEAVELALAWEITVTQQINSLMDLAIKHNDHTSRNFLQWFVNEQIEEVSSMETLRSMVRRAGDQGLLLVESMLARNTPALSEAEAE